MPKSRPLGTIPQLCRAISLQLRHVSTIGKKLLSSSTSSTCPHNMVNFGPLAAEIFVSLGHPCKFQRVSRLGSVTARHSSSGRQANVAALNRRCHLYLAGRPSRWALAHISIYFYLLSSSFSSPILSRGRLDVYHTSTHGAALVRN